MKFEQHTVHDNTAGDENLSQPASKAHNYLFLCLDHQFTEKTRNQI